MLDVNLRRIVPKAAGTYFIVRDNSQVEEIQAENRMRVFFINVEQGPTNMALSFAKGDKTGFKSVFGSGNRVMKKKGNFSIDACLDALDAGPITVVNLRPFDDTLDKSSVMSMNLNGLGKPTTYNPTEVPYRQLFKTTGFWVPNYEMMSDLLGGNNNLLTFGNVSNGNFSIIVTRSNDVNSVTSQGNLSLANCSMEIDEYPAINFNDLVKDTIIDVYLFSADFSLNPQENKYFGRLFDNDGHVAYENLDELCGIAEAGFIRKFTGSVIPNLQNEQGINISINTVINQYFMETGLICHINDDLFEFENTGEIPFMDINAFDLFKQDTNKKFVPKTGVGDFMLSHVLPTELTENDSNSEDALAQVMNIAAKTGDNTKQFITTYGSGVRYDDNILGTTRVVKVVQMEIEGDADNLTDDTEVLVTCDGDVQFNEKTVEEGGETIITYSIIKFIDFIGRSSLKPFTLTGCMKREAQFLDGTANRQNEILDMINDPGIVKGLCGVQGLRYVVDTMKSYVESGYKKQYGQLMDTLDSKNRFVRFIGNEPFINEMGKSTNPMFKQTPNGSLDLSYLETGGNRNFSTKLLTKFATGADKCFFFGPGEVVNNITIGLAGKISNLFYQKSNQFDVVANTTGVIDGVSELEYPLDDDDRAYCEHFRWNPIVFINKQYRIFGNLTAQELRTAQQQITNSELLAYIKENLYNLSNNEHFKRGTYDSYLSTETQCSNFMSSLAMAGVIDSDFVVQCNSTNNTLEIRKQRIKLVHIEYTPVDVIEKVVFDLTIN